MEKSEIRFHRRQQENKVCTQTACEPHGTAPTPAVEQVLTGQDGANTQAGLLEEWTFHGHQAKLSCVLLCMLRPAIKIEDVTVTTLAQAAA